MNKIIPFGKFKGQPIAALATNRNYCDWLLMQPWFVQQFPDLHTIIINNFTESSETPEHNALQIRFIDKVFRAKCTQAIATHIYKRTEGERYYDFVKGSPFIQSIQEPIFEHHGVDVSWVFQQWALNHIVERHTHTIDWRSFKTGVVVECKPCIGDDYPAILRAIKHSRAVADCFVVVAGYVESQTVSFEAIRAFFTLSRVALILVEEIEQTPEPLMIASANELPNPYAFARDIPIPCTECITTDPFMGKNALNF